jgi:hypothetical protein
MVLRRSSALTLLAVALATGSSEAQPAAVRLRGVTIAREAGTVVVTIEATGKLDAPAVGEVDGPPRVFFDFAGVICATRGTAQRGDPDVRRVRAAQHTASPLVTRVVIDLVRPMAFHIETDRLAEGVIRVVLDAADRPTPVPSTGRPTPPAVPLRTAPPPGVAPVPKPAIDVPASAPEIVPTPSKPAADAPVAVSPPAVPTPPATAALPPESSPAPSPAAPVREIDRYRAAAADPLARLLALRPLLTTIDQFASPSPEELQLAADEFDRIRRVMAGIQPPATLRSTHDLLLRASSLGTVATRLRAEANRTSDIGQVRNAGSAAAGSRLLIERACAELGCGPQ